MRNLEISNIILIIGAIATPFLAAWNTWQGTRIKLLEVQMSRLCDNCEYDFTPIKEEKEKKTFQAS